MARLTHKIGGRTQFLAVGLLSLGLGFTACTSTPHEASPPAAIAIWNNDSVCLVTNGQWPRSPNLVGLQWQVDGVDTNVKESRDSRFMTPTVALQFLGGRTAYQRMCYVLYSKGMLDQMRHEHPDDDLDVTGEVWLSEEMAPEAGGAVHVIVLDLTGKTDQVRSQLNTAGLTDDTVGATDRWAKAFATSIDALFGNNHKEH